MLCLLYMFIDLYTCYTSHLWQDEALLVLDGAGVNQRSMVYPFIFALHSLPPLHPLPLLLLLLLPPPPSHLPHTHEFVMICNLGNVELMSQPSFPLHPFPSLPPPLGYEDRISPLPSFTPSLTLSQARF